MKTTGGKRGSIAYTIDFFISNVMEWSYVSMANTLNIPASRIHEIKSGKRGEPNYETIKKVCLALELDIIDFVIIHESFSEKNQKEYLLSMKNRFHNERVCDVVLEVLAEKPKRRW